MSSTEPHLEPCIAMAIGLAVTALSGTHDNETAVGWFYNSATSQDKEYIQEYLNTNGDDIAWVFIREAMKSVSKTCIIQLQVVSLIDNFLE